MTDSKHIGTDDEAPRESSSDRPRPEDATIPFDPFAPSLDTEPPTDPFASVDAPSDPDAPLEDAPDPREAASSEPLADAPRSESSSETQPSPPDDRPVATATSTEPSPPASPTARGRFRGPATRFAPGPFGRIRDLRIWIAGVGGLFVLVALLASEAGIAVMLAAAIIPLAAVISLDRMDVFDREPALILLGIGTVGAIAGAFVALLNGFLLDEFWEENAIDRASVVGLAGELSGRPDGPPFAIYALAGIVVPALAVAAMLAAPVAARRWPAFRNEAMDGVTLGAAAGGGFALGTALVHLWPLISGDAVAGSVADWTVTVLSIVLLRPIIMMTIAALVGLAIWQFDLSRNTRDLIVALAAGLGGAILYALFGLLAEQSGATIQLIWSLAIAATLLTAGRVSLRGAIDFDRRLLAGNRVVCPNCRRVTPAGKFCAFCQQPLPADVTT